MSPEIRHLAYITSAEHRRECNRELGSLLRQERERRGLGLRELARIAEVDASNLSTIERGRLCSRAALGRVLEALATIPVPGEPCECRECQEGRDGVSPWWMIVCPSCGNKRCPRATSHRDACTGSNEPGQVAGVTTTTTEVGHGE